MRRLTGRTFSARLLAVLAALGLVSAGMLATVGSAGASSLASRPAVAAAVTCPTYPLSLGPSVSISTTDPFPGESVTIHGANFDKNAQVRIVMTPPGSTLASVNTGSTGSFTTHVTIPASASGTATISVVGGAPADCLPNTVVIHLQTAGTPPPGGGLAHTGVDILIGLLVALALLVAGLVLTGTGRRRHQPTHAAR